MTKSHTHTYTHKMCKVVREKVKKNNIKHLINENHSTLTVGGIYNNNKNK